MDTDRQLIVRTEGRVCTMEICRTRKMNTLNPAVLRAMSGAIDGAWRRQFIPWPGRLQRTRP